MEISSGRLATLFHEAISYMMIRSKFVDTARRLPSQEYTSCSTVLLNQIRQLSELYFQHVGFIEIGLSEPHLSQIDIREIYSFKVHRIHTLGQELHDRKFVDDAYLGQTALESGSRRSLLKSIIIIVVDRIVVSP